MTLSNPFAIVEVPPNPFTEVLDGEWEVADAIERMGCVAADNFSFALDAQNSNSTMMPRIRRQHEEKPGPARVSRREERYQALVAFYRDKFRKRISESSVWSKQHRSRRRLLPPPSSPPPPDISPERVRELARKIWASGRAEARRFKMRARAAASDGRLAPPVQDALRSYGLL